MLIWWSLKKRKNLSMLYFGRNKLNIVWSKCLSRCLQAGWLLGLLLFMAHVSLANELRQWWKMLMQQEGRQGRVLFEDVKGTSWGPSSRTWYVYVHAYVYVHPRFCTVVWSSALERRATTEWHLGTSVSRMKPSPENFMARILSENNLGRSLAWGKG